MAIEISRAGPERVTALVDVLARSFADDPIVRWPFPTDGSAVEQCRELFRILDERFVHTGWLWEADDGAGVAMWVPPGAAERFVEIELETRVPIDAMTGDGGVRYRGFWDWIEAHLPPEPHWFLDHLAVAPNAGAKGLGVALGRARDRVRAPGRGPRLPGDRAARERGVLRAARVPGGRGR